LASQPTLSRFTALMAEPANLKVLREAVLELAGRGIRAEQGGKRMPSVTLDADSAADIQHWEGKAYWPPNDKWPKRALGAAQIRDKTNGCL
jgi:hypothetical protein